MTCTHHCQLRYGLFCANGRRGVFTSGDACALCTRLGWQHSTLPRCGGPEIAPAVADSNSYTAGVATTQSTIESSARGKPGRKTEKP